MRILGIDPGLRITGYGVIDAGPGAVRIVEAGVVRPAGTDLASRVASLYDGLAEVIAAHAPRVMSVEQLYAHYDHPRTAILMGHARGVVLLAAAKADIPVAHYASTRVKRTVTGHGHATKEQMQRAVQREFALAAKPEPPDVADALAIALTHWYASKSKA
ncbi:MAG: crossover junction endodeoxyribonuclease RuvC [Gemmataceae bacterium]|nr:crossover junction endodeoxyribonuclease RuvC [Gemmataceae bacterium]